MKDSLSTKRRTFNEKDILELLSLLEEKFDFDENKLKDFIKIFSKDQIYELSEEETLTSLKEYLSEFPVLILELNKILPKSYRIVKFIIIV